MRSIASGELCHSALCSRGRRRAPCPGYEFSIVYGMVARTGAQRRLRETCARGLETMTGVKGHRVFSGSEYQRWIRAAKGSVALRHLYPVAFRQADNRQLWRNHQQLADPLFAHNEESQQIVKEAATFFKRYRLQLEAVAGGFAATPRADLAEPYAEKYFEVADWIWQNKTFPQANTSVTSPDLMSSSS